MRILHLIIGLNTGGAEIMLQRLVERHQGSPAFHHEVISLTDTGPIGVRLKEKGVTVHALGLHSLIDAPRVLWALYRLIRKTKPDIMQTWMVHADLIGGIVARLAGCPHVVWSLHACNIALAGTASARWLLPLCARLSVWIPVKIIAVSQACSLFHAQRGYDSSRIVVIPNGLDIVAMKATPQARTRLRQEEGIPDSAMVIGCVARFNGTKDIETLVRAAGLVLSQNKNVHFMLVGTDMTKSNPPLNAWIGRESASAAFHLMGERADIPDCLAAMDIFCLSSITESFGLAVAEAMAMEKPCVTTNVDDLPALLGEGGVTVPSSSPKALASALTAMIEAPEAYRAELGRKGKEHVEAHFSLTRMMALYEALYLEIIREAK
ncbi:MAG: glycosyltransferase [Bdellovibrionales bacterium]|jgi:glycosyltransferase involved in cell wall biosynthesis